ncbi:hypothetical protein K0T92_23205 [Paenibacillus oenotherae]|uniref:Uncharacterized protein n=1 Tax=Paenibacillus oenotherae TaxID=1435645 RepID=A0ABS7DCH2_9BACL|nr:hypothetical protein [Paenibacillus oenotherae]MBW7477633.1 hypothetical protein [Paenibacillus oenotherae]
MERKNTFKRWSTLLLTAVLSITLLMSASACMNDSNSNGNNNGEVDNTAPIVTPAEPDVNINTDSTQ